ncbi:MAG TPA: GNAT family protein [Acidimicrobiales bacterium]|nr:GNAT family protein [Acidimicrobiales bacterium]
MAERVTLAGRYVRLEPLTVAHAADLAAAAVDRSTYAYTWVPDGPRGAEAYVADALAEEAAGNHLPFATVRLPDGAGGEQVVGSTRFIDTAPWQWPPWAADRQRAGVPDAVEIGHTWLAAAAQRTVVNTEAKLLMLTHAFDTWEVYRVRLKTDARNARSRAAIERLGATLEGVLRAAQPAADGTVRDTAMFSITAAEWPAVRADLRARLDRPRRG